MVIALRVVQFWCEIKLVITNRTPAARSCDFVITRLISAPNCTPLSAITIINLGFPLHSEKSKSSSKSSTAEEKSHGRQYVSQAQQQPQSMVAGGSQQAYGQYSAGYGQAQSAQSPLAQQQYDQQQNAQQLSSAGQQLPATPGNRGHGGTLYSHGPVPDPKSKS